MQDIHDIRPPVMVGWDPAHIRLGLTGLGGLILVLVLALVIRYFWKKRQPKGIMDLTPSIPAHERAVTDLDKLSLTLVHDAKAFYFQLSHVVKAYMGEVLGIRCLEMTTQEFARALKALDLPSELKLRIARFQDICDPFRYSPIAPGPEQVQKDLALARSLIDAVEKECSPPQPEPESTVDPLPVPASNKGVADV